MKSLKSIEEIKDLRYYNWLTAFQEAACTPDDSLILKNKLKSANFFFKAVPDFCFGYWFLFWIFILQSPIHRNHSPWKPMVDIHGNIVFADSQLTSSTNHVLDSLFSSFFTFLPLMTMLYKAYQKYGMVFEHIELVYLDFWLESLTCIDEFIEYFDESLDSYLILLFLLDNTLLQAVVWSIYWTSNRIYFRIPVEDFDRTNCINNWVLSIETDQLDLLNYYIKHRTEIRNYLFQAAISKGFIIDNNSNLSSDLTSVDLLLPKDPPLNDLQYFWPRFLLLLRLESVSDKTARLVASNIFLDVSSYHLAATSIFDNLSETDKIVANHIYAHHFR